MAVKRRISGYEKWAKLLFRVEITLFIVGIIWMVLSMGSIAVALTGFIWMAIVPVAIINLIVSFMATLEEENNGGTGTTRLIFIIHLIIAMFLIRNVTD